MSKLTRTERTLLEVARGFGLPVVVTEGHGPRDRRYDGRELSIDIEAIEDLLMHELCHWLVAHQLGYCDKEPNYGIGHQGRREVQTAVGNWDPLDIETRVLKLEAHLSRAVSLAADVGGRRARKARRELRKVRKMARRVVEKGEAAENDLQRIVERPRKVVVAQDAQGWRWYVKGPGGREAFGSIARYASVDEAMGEAVWALQPASFQFEGEDGTGI